MGSFTSKLKITKRGMNTNIGSGAGTSGTGTIGRQRKDSSSDSSDSDDMENESQKSLPGSPIPVPRCNHAIKKTKGKPHNLCSKCGLIVNPSTQILGKINAEKKRRDKLKLKVKDQMDKENDDDPPAIADPDGKLDLSDTCIEYPPIAPGLVPLTSLPQHTSVKISYQQRQRHQENLKCGHGDDEASYFLDKSKPKFMTIKRGKSKASYPLDDEM